MRTGRTSTSGISTSGWALWALAGLLGVGCGPDDGAAEAVEDEGDGPLEVDATASAISRSGGASWGTPGNDGAILPLGYTHQETCFLSGITGSLESAPTLPGVPAVPAEVVVYPQAGRWYVRTRAGTGPGVMAHVRCVNVPYNPSLEFSWSNNAPSWSVPWKPNRHCFLRRVWATTGLAGGTGLQPSIRIVASGADWSFHGSYVTTAGASNFGGATAVCIDLPSNAGVWTYAFTGPTNGANSATASHVLRDSYPSGPTVPTADVACGLTGIGGRWVSGSPNPLGWSNGADLDDSLSFWRLAIDNGRTAHVRCVR